MRQRGDRERPTVERHLAELHASAIRDEVIDQERITITTITEVARLGYARSPDGSNGLYVIKPDHSRPKKDKAGKVKPGKFNKYEWPAGVPHRLDIVGDLPTWPTRASTYTSSRARRRPGAHAEMRRRGRRCVASSSSGAPMPLGAGALRLSVATRLLPDRPRRPALSEVVFDSDREASPTLIEPRGCSLTAWPNAAPRSTTSSCPTSPTAPRTEPTT